MMEMNTTDVFLRNWNATATILINQGGTSSGKTWAIDQVLVQLAICEPGAQITVTGESIPNLKKGAYRDMQNLFATTPNLNKYVLKWNSTERVIVFKNGSFIEFISNLNEQSAKNGKRDYLFVNEAQGIPYPIFIQLALRTRKKIFIDYNPSEQFWVHDKLIGTRPGTNDLNATVELIISDHRHNIFLSEQEHAKIEGILDPELWKVYARGLTGNITGLIFGRWQQIPDEAFPWDEDDVFAGLDFGYTNDPTAGVRCAKVGKSIFLHELFYETAFSPQKQKEIFQANGFSGNERPIYAEHDEDQISQLRRLRLLVYPARKGPGSIKAGIQYLNDHTVFYTASSTNIDFERRRYKWLVDPVTGLPTNTPIDQFNHLMDAARYGAYTHGFSRAA